jgi:hypothetical protein
MQGRLTTAVRRHNFDSTVGVPIPGLKEIIVFSSPSKSDCRRMLQAQNFIGSRTFTNLVGPLDLQIQSLPIILQT